MSQQSINLGTADRGNGDPLRVAFDKVNDNFAELYSIASMQPDLGDWAFKNNSFYSLSGGYIDNSDTTHSSTAGLTIPTNGGTNPITLANTYGNVALVSGANPSALKTWTFGADGLLKLPVGGDIVDSTGTSVLGAVLTVIDGGDATTWATP